MKTTRKPAAALVPGDYLRTGSQPEHVCVVKGSSRAMASTADRICIFVENIDGTGKGAGYRFYFDLDELVPVVHPTAAEIYLLAETVKARREAAKTADVLVHDCDPHAKRCHCFGPEAVAANEAAKARLAELRSRISA